MRSRCILWIAASTAWSCGSVGGVAKDDPLAEGFQHPPAVAAPRVWWHWMNGNITEVGIRLDLEWMHRVGIGGAQVFEGDLGTSQVVPEPLPYMRPGWAGAFRTAADTAARLGIELTIASSPGWSSAGGPWVRPVDAMKKFVWSETEVVGGKRFHGALPLPPDTAGPFQGIPKSAVQASAPDDLPHFYRDSAVMAFRDTTGPLGRPLNARTAIRALDIAVLQDGDFKSGIDLSASNETWLEARFETPQRVSAVLLGLPGLQGFGAAPPPVALLQISQDGKEFTTVAILNPTSSPVRSASFAAVTAKLFRISLGPDSSLASVGTLPPAPGAVTFPRPPPPKEYKITEWRMFADARVHAFAEKAGFAAAPDYYALDTPADAVQHPVKANEVIDLSSTMKPDGVLDWKAPAGGIWRVLRLGYSLTGQQNGPAPRNATGLEVDKLNGPAVDRYLDTYLSMYDRVLESGAGALSSLLTDSIESGPQNWTDDLLIQFKRLRGYDPMRWLPVLTGVVVDSAADSDRFLWDFRKTLSDLLASEYYGRVASKAHQRGWQYYAEALEDHRPQLGDDLQMRSAADIPMGAMWMFASDGPPNPTYVADLQGAASVAHLFGKPLVAAESFTAFGWPWGFSPRDLKHVADLEFSLGVNRIAIHESTHQPFTDRRPGLALAPLLGQYFNRNETWAPLAGAWISYLARSSFMLQQGSPHADVAYFSGEEAPLTSLFGNQIEHDLPQGYPFDFVNADALLNCMGVVENRLVSCGGSRYRVLYLGASSSRMSLPTLVRIAELVTEGASLIGERPVESPSRADDPAAWHRAVNSLFGPSEMKGHPRAVGRGRVVEAPLAASLQELGIEADWMWRPSHAGTLRVLHRHLTDGEMYFISNPSGTEAAGELDVRVTGKRPQLWSADTAEVKSVAYRTESQYTTVPLRLQAVESVFLVLREPTSTPHMEIPSPEKHLLTEIPGPWRLDFPEDVTVPKVDGALLGSWTESPTEDIRYFSGIGRYQTTVVAPSQWLSHGKRIYLDLGTVNELASVTINGKPAGIVWHAPYRLEVSSLLMAGRNRISVEVANLWVNRLIGDARHVGKPQTFTTGPTYKPEAPLRSSGLLGPVRLIAVGD